MMHHEKFITISPPAPTDNKYGPKLQKDFRNILVDDDSKLNYA